MCPTKSMSRAISLAQPLHTGASLCAEYCGLAQPATVQAHQRKVTHANISVCLLQEITLHEALCGVSFTITHLDGRVLQVTISLYSCAGACTDVS